MKKIIAITLLSLGVSFLVACSVSENKDSLPQVSVDVKSVLHSHDTSQQDIPDIIENPYQEPKWVERPALSQKTRFSGALESHNRVRTKHHLSPLKWSNQLAKISQNWANQLGKGNHCQMYHRKGNIPFGENLYRSSAIVWTDGRREINPVSIKDVVKVWMDEEKWYDYKNNRCLPGKDCYHYTQAVWKGTTEVGCAMKVCPDKSQSWVCSYFPAGNYVGSRPY